MTRPARALSPSHALAGLMLGAGLLLQSGVVLSAGSSTRPGDNAPGDWLTYGHDAGGMRYSPLTQIDTTNVATLQRVWTYHMRPVNAAAASQAAAPAPSLGRCRWVSSDNLPAAVAKTGRQNIGGSIATASGLIFIGATDDARLRACDAKTGAELWAFKLEASAHATPVTNLGSDGSQYVAVVGAGGSFLDSPIASDALSVFALP